MVLHSPSQPLSNNILPDYNHTNSKKRDEIYATIQDKTVIQMNDSSAEKRKSNDMNKNSEKIKVPIKLRPVEEKDKEYIKSLHEGWFPVRYNQEFYDSMVLSTNKIHNDSTASDNSTSDGNTNNKLSDKIISFIAEFDTSENYLDDDSDDCCGNNETQNLLHKNNSSTKPCVNVNKNEIPNVDIESSNDNILGCIVGSFFSYQKCSKPIQTLLLPSNPKYKSMFYIMTLGTVPKYRNLGLGSILVERCVDFARRNRECGVIYLHVIKYNKGAIRFYEKLGFGRVTEIQDYYIIDGVKYNCYLYAKCLNGNHLSHGFSIINYIQDIFISIWNLFATPFQSMLSIESSA